MHLSFVTEDPKLLARNYIVEWRLYESAPVNINKKDLGFGTWSWHFYLTGQHLYEPRDLGPVPTPTVPMYSRSRSRKQRSRIMDYLIYGPGNAETLNRSVKWLIVLDINKLVHTPPINCPSHNKQSAQRAIKMSYFRTWTLLTRLNQGLGENSSYSHLRRNHKIERQKLLYKSVKTDVNMENIVYL